MCCMQLAGNARPKKIARNLPSVHHHTLVKICMEYEVEGSRPRGRPKRTWSEVVQEDSQHVV